MNTQLIADAVRKQQGSRRSDHLGQAFRVLVRRLVYTQIWEDPEADLAALQLPLGIDDRHHLIRGVQRAVLSHGEAGAGLTPSTSMRRTFRCSSSSSRACALSRNTPISGSFLARAPRPSNSELYHRRCGRCSMPMRALTGQAQRGRTSAARPISPTGSTATACSAALSALPICWRNAPGLILRRC